MVYMPSAWEFYDSMLLRSGSSLIVPFSIYLTDTNLFFTRSLHSQPCSASHDRHVGVSLRSCTWIIVSPPAAYLFQSLPGCTTISTINCPLPNNILFCGGLTKRQAEAGQTVWLGSVCSFIGQPYMQADSANICNPSDQIPRMTEPCINEGSSHMMPESTGKCSRLRFRIKTRRASPRVANAMILILWLTTSQLNLATLRAISCFSTPSMLNQRQYSLDYDVRPFTVGRKPTI